MQDLEKGIDNRIEHQFHETYDEKCSTCYSENRLIQAHKTVNKEVCEFCEGVGFITKTEWVGTDDSYDVELRCVCQKE